MANIKTMEEYTEDANKTTQKQREKALKAQEDSANAKINQTNDAYNKAIVDAKVAYEDEYQRNAVQKLINERTIAERNANLGLTDSGLNRTQLTANQMSYANQKGKIDLTRQNAITTLEGNLASAIATIKQENEANKLVINQNYDQYNTELATQMYNADIAKAQIEAQLEAQRAQEQAAKAAVLQSTIGNGGDNITIDDIVVDENGKIIKIVGCDLANSNSETPTISGFRTTKGDNFTVTIGEKSYKVENEGKVKSKKTLKSISEGKTYGNITVAENGNAYIKNGNDYYRIGNINGFLNIGISSNSGYNDLLLALSK